MTPNRIIANIRSSKDLSKDFDALPPEKKREVLEIVKNDKLADIGDAIKEVETGQRNLFYENVNTNRIH